LNLNDFWLLVNRRCQANGGRLRVETNDLRRADVAAVVVVVVDVERDGLGLDRSLLPAHLVSML